MIPRAQLRSYVRKASRVEEALAVSARVANYGGAGQRYAATVLTIATAGRAISAEQLAALTGTTKRTAARAADELVGYGFLSRGDYVGPSGDVAKAETRYDLAVDQLDAVRETVARLDPEGARL